MPDHVTQDARLPGRMGADPVEELAGRVLSVLAARAPDAPGGAGHIQGQTPQPREDAAVTGLVSAVQHGEEAERDREVARILDSGVSIATLIDHHIPEAARRMGEAWCSDGMSFAEVTIGSARLQALLRDLARRDAVAPRDLTAPQVLMVVREDDHHTLGAMVAMQQLRRTGIDVHLSMGQPDREILARIATRDFDMVMVSSSGSEKLESLGTFVENVHSYAQRAVPIVVGGTVLGENTDVAAKTGADFATADPNEAVRRCGLRMPRQSAVEAALSD